MKYLILGGSSFYGRSFIRLLESKGEEVISLSRPEFDITKNYSLPEADVIFNFVAESLVAESWEDPERWLHTNVICTNRLFEKVIKQHNKKPIQLFCHISTPEVFGSSSFWVKEKNAHKPTTPYAVSRSAAEMLLIAYWKAHKFPAIISRTANIYGEGQQEFRLIPKAFRMLLNGEKFPIHGKGNSSRSFIHVSDACEALYILSKKAGWGEAYHISTQKTYKVIEVVKMICDLLGKTLKNSIEFHPERLGKDHMYLLNSDKMRNLNWTDKITIEKGLTDYAHHAIERFASPRISIKA